MLTNKLILNSLLKSKSAFRTCQVAGIATGNFFDEREVIGNREWVGYGVISLPHYVDRADYPMPAIRFKEIKGNLIALKEKEKGDWKKLTLEEKKELYRASFCQTLAEVYAPTGKWKSILGLTLLFISAGLWFFILEKIFIIPPLPDTFSEEHRRKMLRKMLVNRDGHLSGLSSKWDYEKDDWK